MQKENLAVIADEQLALRFQVEGDAIAFGELYRRYYPKLYHYCQHLIHQPEEAADIAQDTFAKAAEKIQQLKSKALFSSWLFRIAHNACMDHLKQVRHFKETSLEGALPVANEDFDIESAEDYELKLSRLSRLLEELSPEARALLLSKYCDGQSIESLTKTWGISESAVKMRLARARNRIYNLYHSTCLAS